MLKQLFRDPKVGLIIGFAILSWYATFDGLKEFLIGGGNDLEIIPKFLLGAFVALLMGTIIWILNELFKRLGWWRRLLFISGYAFLTLISIGFGFGFYYKNFVAQEVSTRNVQITLASKYNDLRAGEAAIKRLAASFKGLSDLSDKKADQEEINGTSCPNSKPGKGRRTNWRYSEKDKFNDYSTTTENLVKEFTVAKLDPIKKKLEAISKGLDPDPNSSKKLITPDDRNRAYERVIRIDLSGPIIDYNSIIQNPVLLDAISTLKVRANQTIFRDPNGNTGDFNCPDQVLKQRILSVINAFEQLPKIQRNDNYQAGEGGRAVIYAFRRLQHSTLGWVSELGKLKSSDKVSAKPPSTPSTLTRQQKIGGPKANGIKKTSASSAPTTTNSGINTLGLTNDDYFPLFIAGFVDFCILLLAVSRRFDYMSPIKQIDPEDYQQFKVIFDEFEKAYGPIGEALKDPNYSFRSISGAWFLAFPKSNKTLSSNDAAKSAALESFVRSVDDLGFIEVSYMMPWRARQYLKQRNSIILTCSSFYVYRFRPDTMADFFRAIALT